MATVLLVAAACAGCTRSALPKARRAVGEAMAHLEYRRGSRIQYLAVELGSGSVIGVPDPMPPVTLSSSGYLLFIDEQPGYDWDHASQLVFVPADAPGRPIVLCRDRRGPGPVRDHRGELVTGPWERH